MRIDADFGDFQRALDDLQRKIEKAKSMHDQNVPLTELLDPAFMLKYTQFSSIEDMLEQGGFSADSQEAFERIPQEQLDEFTAAHTNFASWAEMLQTAAQEWVLRTSGLSQE